MIAVANGTNENPASTIIHCYRVSIKKQMDNITINSQSLPSFFLTGGAARDIPGSNLTAFLLIQTYLVCLIFFPIDRHFGNIFEMDIQRRFGFIACWNQNTNRLFYWAVGLDGESNTDSFTFQALISAAKQNRSVQNIRKHIQSLLVNYSSPYK